MHLSQEGPPRPGDERATTVTPAGHFRILVVEDDFLIGMLLGEMLEIMGHDVCATETTEAGAIAAAAKWHPTMIIIDAQLREGNGISAIDQILKNGSVPHVFVTGDIRGVRKLRPDAIIVEKPFTESELDQAMTRALTTI